jgi:hypothetical protein
MTTIQGDTEMDASARMRPLDQRERDLLSMILSAPVPGAAELAAQLDAARVTGHWGSTLSIDIEVPDSVPPASQATSGVLPVDTEVIDEAGGPIGEILVWVDSGRLAALEFAWYVDVPEILPGQDRIIVTSKT